MLAKFTVRLVCVIATTALPLSATEVVSAEPRFRTDDPTHQNLTIRTVITDSLGTPLADLPITVMPESPLRADAAAADSDPTKSTNRPIVTGRTDNRGFISLRGSLDGGGERQPVTVLIGDGPAFFFHAEVGSGALTNPQTLRIPSNALQPNASNSSGSRKSCPAGFPTFWQRSPGGNFMDRDVAIGRIRTLRKTRVQMTYSDSTSTTAEVMGSVGAGLFAAGQRRVAARSASAVFATAPNSGGKQYNVTVRYIPRDMWCRNPSTQATWMTPAYEWTPDQWTGGSGKDNWDPWTCDPRFRTTIAADLTIGSSQSVVSYYSVGVTVAGRSGTTTQEYSKAQSTQLTYALAGGAKKADICGQAGVPASDGRVIEVP